MLSSTCLEHTVKSPVLDQISGPLLIFVMQDFMETAFKHLQNKILDQLHAAIEGYVRTYV